MQSAGYSNSFLKFLRDKMETENESREFQSTLRETDVHEVKLDRLQYLV